MNVNKYAILGILLTSFLIGLIATNFNNSNLNAKTENKENDKYNVSEKSPFISDPFIPPLLPPNENFRWNFWNDTQLGFIFERFNDTEYNFGEFYYNISYMPRIFSNSPFTNGYYYCVQLEEIYFNTTLNKIMPIENRPLLNVSLVNITTIQSIIPIIPDFSSGPFPGWFFTFINPFIPTNGTLALSWSAARLKVWYENILEMGSFDIESVDEIKNNIFFRDSTSKAYVNLTYDDNGILINGSIYYKDEESGWTTVTLKTTFNVNPINDLEWSVEVGEFMYWGLNRNELRLNITKIENITILDPNIGSFIFQQVNASISMWNYQSMQWNSMGGLELVIGSANEYHPLLFPPGQQILPLLLPKGYKLTDLLAIYKNLASPGQRWASAALEGDWIVQYNLSNQEFAKFLYNKSTGIVELVHTQNFEWFFGEEDAVFYLKNATKIDNTKIWKINYHSIGTKDFNITLNISVSDDTELLYSGFNINPINETLNYGALFLDIWVNDSENLNQINFAPINITIEYNPSKYPNMRLWYFNITSQNPKNTWKDIPFKNLGNGVIVFTYNYTGIFAFTNAPIEQILRLLLGDDDDDGGKAPPAVVPLGNYYLIFLLVAMIGIVLYTKRKLVFK